MSKGRSGSQAKARSDLHLAKKRDRVQGAGASREEEPQTAQQACANRLAKLVVCRCACYCVSLTPRLQKKRLDGMQAADSRKNRPDVQPVLQEGVGFCRLRG